MSSHVNAITEAIDQLAGWEPENADDLPGTLDALPLIFHGLARAVHVISERLTTEFPVHPIIGEELQEGAAMTDATGDAFEEIGPMARAAHAAEMERIENPRPNEELWDVGKNQ